MAGRVVLSSHEIVKATSTSVVCMSPVDSSPLQLFLPCIRFRDLAVSWRYCCSPSPSYRTYRRYSNCNIRRYNSS
ncbi:hypothetical protein RSOL_381190 [Rhizoctonia solani AG-3 Rhs1AP]|uniref:Uncharacterized protein n=1 Tax=Rhizoctonia solani AG-3 Rhs1AP TaxID=1086054 RepID=X8JBK6_9AGAM|nr:hypothetical protein RSOL_381190 [Rhizoctonia solani AG-3 Rhs1AP]